MIWRSNIRLHPSVVQRAVTVPASPSEPFSSIFLSTGLKNHRGSRARRGRRDYSDQTTDRRAHGPNVMYAASLASRGDPDSSGPGVSLLSSVTLARTWKTAAFCFYARLLSPRVHILGFILFSALLLSLFDCTQHLTNAAAPSPAEAEPSLNFNYVSGTSCRCAKGYNDRNYFCNHRSSPRQSVTSIQDRASFPHPLIERLKFSVHI